MKLTHLALILTIGLLGLTTWLAWDTHNQAAGARNELEMYQRREAAGARSGATTPADIAAQNALLLREQQILAMQNAGAKGNDRSPDTSSQTPAANTLPALPPVKPAPQQAANLQPALSRAQHKVLSMTALAKVIEYQKEFGFVVLNAGSTKNVATGSIFLLRRGSAIVARIKIGDVENETAVASLDPKSIPPGVTVEVGDEVIQDIPASELL